MTDPTLPSPAGPWPVTLYTPIDQMVRELVRYQGLGRGYDCLPRQRHEARAPLDEIPLATTETKRIWTMTEVGIRLDDPRWPTTCAGGACPAVGGYAFATIDPYVIFGWRLMRPIAVGTGEACGEPVRIDQLPYGALYRANTAGAPISVALDPPRGLLTREDGDGTTRLHGEAFMVVTPAGLWWLGETHPDRTGARHRVGLAPTRRLFTVQDAGPPAPWTLSADWLCAAPPAGRTP